jgi:plastocyanin
MTRDGHHLRRLGALLLSVGLLAGCVRVASESGGGATPVPTGTAPTGAAATADPAGTPDPLATDDPPVDPSPTVAPTPTPNDGAEVVEVKLLDSLSIDPARITVDAGKPVRFVITNAGALEHDFFIGSDREQRQREGGQGEPGPDRYLKVPPGQTLTLTYVFPSKGKSIVGCVIPGHYSAGMRSSITIR